MPSTTRSSAKRSWATSFARAASPRPAARSSGSTSTWTEPPATSASTPSSRCRIGRCSSPSSAEPAETSTSPTGYPPRAPPPGEPDFPSTRRPSPRSPTMRRPTGATSRSPSPRSTRTAPMLPPGARNWTAFSTRPAPSAGSPSTRSSELGPYGSAAATTTCTAIRGRRKLHWIPWDQNLSFRTDMGHAPLLPITWERGEARHGAHVRLDRPGRTVADFQVFDVLLRNGVMMCLLSGCGCGNQQPARGARYPVTSTYRTGCRGGASPLPRRKAGGFVQRLLYDIADAQGVRIGT